MKGAAILNFTLVLSRTKQVTLDELDRLYTIYHNIYHEKEGGREGCGEKTRGGVAGGKYIREEIQTRVRSARVCLMAAFLRKIHLGEARLSDSGVKLRKD